MKSGPSPRPREGLPAFESRDLSGGTPCVHLSFRHKLEHVFSLVLNKTQQHVHASYFNQGGEFREMIRLLKGSFMGSNAFQ